MLTVAGRPCGGSSGGCTAGSGGGAPGAMGEAAGPGSGAEPAVLGAGGSGEEDISRGGDIRLATCGDAAGPALPEPAVRSAVGNSSPDDSAGEVGLYEPPTSSTGSLEGCCAGPFAPRGFFLAAGGGGETITYIGRGGGQTGILRLGCFGGRLFDRAPALDAKPSLTMQSADDEDAADGVSA